MGIAIAKIAQKSLRFRCATVSSGRISWIIVFRPKSAKTYLNNSQNRFWSVNWTSVISHSHIFMKISWNSWNSDPQKIHEKIIKLHENSVRIWKKIRFQQQKTLQNRVFPETLQIRSEPNNHEHFMIFHRSEFCSLTKISWKIHENSWNFHDFHEFSWTVECLVNFHKIIMKTWDFIRFHDLFMKTWPFRDISVKSAISAKFSRNLNSFMICLWDHEILKKFHHWEGLEAGGSKSGRLRWGAEAWEALLELGLVRHTKCETNTFSHYFKNYNVLKIACA